MELRNIIGVVIIGKILQRKLKNLQKDPLEMDFISIFSQIYNVSASYVWLEAI